MTNRGWAPIWHCGPRRIDLRERPLIMGILNVTPDSFSDGGRYCDLDRALAHGRQMIDEGADIIDVGGESTRPGAESVLADEEKARVLPVIQGLRTESDVLMSIDTAKASVAEAALEAGAHIINDVTGLRGDPAMRSLAAESQAGLVVMHMQGEPRTMQASPCYEDVVAEVRQFYQERLDVLQAAGVKAEQILFDPGIGFGKTVDHNLELVSNLAALDDGLRPQLLGVSRKSFIGKVLGLETPERLEGSLAVNTIGLWQGVVCLRVHDVSATRRAADMAVAVRRKRRNRPQVF